jgi:hypothetical protein
MECRLNVAFVGILATTSLDAKRFQKEERKRMLFFKRLGRK